LGAFYAHPRMADGLLNFCKTCVRNRVGTHRKMNLDRIRAYDRQRGKTEHRKETNRRVNQRRVSDGRHAEMIRKWRLRYPDKYRAHRILNNAIRDGLVVRGCCEVC